MITEPELRSIETALAELADRVAAAGDALRDTSADSVAVDLYEAERHLRTARRRITAAADSLTAGAP
ncbi:hypothetical protein [Microbacterium maritypicum]|uniref:hypothetical protein n=1 Tax=Microbacterium maritypicum TaxID=33918 RepID=UPI00296EEC31|nr:hypothetical protein [Microbacterium liquefaciens]